MEGVSEQHLTPEEYRFSPESYCYYCVSLAAFIGSMKASPKLYHRRAVKPFFKSDVTPTPSSLVAHTSPITTTNLILHGVSVRQSNLVSFKY